MYFTRIPNFHFVATMPHGNFSDLRSSLTPRDHHDILVSARRHQLELKQRVDVDLLVTEWRSLRVSSASAHHPRNHPQADDDLAEPLNNQAESSAIDEATREALATAEAKLAELEDDRRAKDEWLAEQRRKTEEQAQLTECLTARYSTSSSSSFSDRSERTSKSDEDEDDILAYYPHPEPTPEPKAWREEPKAAEAQPQPEPQPRTRRAIARPGFGQSSRRRRTVEQSAYQM